MIKQIVYELVINRDDLEIKIDKKSISDYLLHGI